jgi:hypothetical protein
MSISQEAAEGIWILAIATGFASGLIAHHFVPDPFLDLGVGILGTIVGLFLFGIIVSIGSD